MSGNRSATMEVEWGIDPATIREISPGIWFAYREQTDGVTRGIWWCLGREDPVLLLSAWSELDGVFWETISPVAPRMLCSHANLEDAHRCAIRRLLRGHTCRQRFWHGVFRRTR